MSNLVPMSEFKRRREVAAVECQNTRLLKLLPCLTLLWVAAFPLILRAQDMPIVENAARMSPKQYAAFLDELDSKLPLLKVHFEMLCATPAWRNESSDLQSVDNQVFAECRSFSKEVTASLSESIAKERLNAQLSVEFKMQFGMNELMHTASLDGSLRPYYDPRSEDADFILKTLAPLFHILYGHVYASISDDSLCTPAEEPQK
jgi:hypothetical protein